MKTTIKKLVNTRIFWIIVSLLLSVILWCYVTIDVGAEIDETFKGVEVVFSGENALQKKELLVTEVEDETVSLTLFGDRKVISQLKSSDLHVIVDVSEITETGKMDFNYTIDYPNHVNSNGIKLLDSSTEVISFQVEKLVTKNISVKGEYTGSIAENHTAEPLRFDPASITISGPVDEVAQVAYAWVEIPQDHVERTLQFDSNYIFMDEDNKKLKLHYTSADTLAISVTLPVVEVKEVPLALNIIEGGGANEDDAAITITPATVTLSGDSAILADINKIVLGTVDLNDITDTFEQTYPIVIDDQLKNQSGISEATVKIEIKGLATREITVKNFKCINLKKGYQADISTKSLDIVLRGPQEVLDAIDAKNVTAIVDLANLNGETGWMERKVEIVIKDVKDAGALGDYVVSLNVKEE